MPDMTPVANQIQPPDLSKGINTFSGLLGIQQQKQALQTGQYAQQAAHAEADQAQQKNAELQALHTFTMNAMKDPSYQLADGTPDTVKYQRDAMQVAPTYGQPVIGQASSNFKEAIDTRRAVQALSGEQNDQLGKMLKGLAGNPEATPTDLLDAIDQQRANNKDPGFNRALDNMLMSIDRRDIAGSAAKAAASLAGISPSAGSNAAGQNQVVNPLTQERSMPKLSGGATNPTTPQVAGTTARVTGTAGGDIDRMNDVSGMQQSAAAAIPLTERIDQLAKDINSGKVAKMISETGNYFGLSSINEARSQLNKDLGQVKGIAISHAGSDSRAATILEGYPTDTTPENTIHAAMDYIRGAARQSVARGQLLSQYQKKDPDGVRGFRAADDVLTRTSNPLMHEFMSLKPADQAGFYRRNFSTPQEAQAFKDQVNALKNHTNVLGQQ